MPTRYFAFEAQLEPNGRFQLLEIAPLQGNVSPEEMLIRYRSTAVAQLVQLGTSREKAQQAVLRAHEISDVGSEF